jgi:hypothetical protein
MLKNINRNGRNLLTKQEKSCMLINLKFFEKVFLSIPFVETFKAFLS